MIAVGFDGLPAAADLDRVEREFADRRAPLQAEVSTLAAAELHGGLVGRGYEPRGFENVLGHALTDVAPADPAVLVARAEPHVIPALMEVLVTAFTTPDIGGVGGDSCRRPRRCGKRSRGR